MEGSKNFTTSHIRLHSAEVDDDVVDVVGHEGYQEGHCDQVNGNHLPCGLQGLCIDIEALGLGLWILLLSSGDRGNSVEHVGVHGLTLNL